MRQVRIPTVFMRGGTSRALFFRPQDLPSDPALRDRVILAVYGSPDPYRRQLDGIGGATSSTSKVAVVGPAQRPDADVDYEFGQVGIDAAIIDRGGNCGNISAAVGPYAIEEGLVAAQEPITRVRVFNTNTQKIIVAHVHVADGTFQPEGEYAIKGVPGTGSKIVLDYLDPGGSVTGRLFPTGHARDLFQVPGLGEVEATLVDASNPLVICRMEALGLEGLEAPAEIDANKALLASLEHLRGQAAVACGLAASPEEALRRTPAIPRVAFVRAPRAYTSTEGQLLDEGQRVVLARMTSMGRVHSSYAATGAIATAVAAFVPGTVAYEVARPSIRQGGEAGRERGWVRLGHPAGVMELGVEVEQVDGQWRAASVSTARTARRLMEGWVYAPASIFQAASAGLAGVGA
ncbi:MAG: hypothetical protein HY690_03785 [Chloroflexi bacterium]|nr:hypothetical protein [Chloroflexota bacterium]